MSLDLTPALEHPFTGLDADAVAELGPLVTGKVRDIVDLGDTIALIATDRISAFDHVAYFCQLIGSFKCSSNSSIFFQPISLCEKH